MIRVRPAVGTAQVKWLSTRQRKRRSKASPQQIVGLRLHELARLLRHRYQSHHLPNDDSGRDDIEPVIHHIAALAQPARRAMHWLELWAPWLTLQEQREIISRGIATARPWTADQLAWRYRITRQERDMLALTTIGAVDHAKRARTKRRKDRERQRKAAVRRAKGSKPRREYEGASLTRAKPWVETGISRATWYRRRAHETETGPVTA